jgi:hypothetical protein
MEYETTSRWRNSYRKKPSTPKSFFYDVCLGICKHGTFAPYKAEEPRSPSIIECYRQIKANRKMNKTRIKVLAANQVIKKIPFTKKHAHSQIVDSQYENVLKAQMTGISQ